MNWEECDKVLCALAKRNGCEYERAWYGEYWDGFFTGKSDAWYKCFICGEKICSYPIDSLGHTKWLMIEEAKKHGMQHLKEKGLLIFM